MHDGGVNDHLMQIVTRWSLLVQAPPEEATDGQARGLFSSNDRGYGTACGDQRQVVGYRDGTIGSAWRAGDRAGSQAGSYGQLWRLKQARGATRATYRRGAISNSYANNP
jgi:hypothetical protein